MDLYNKMVIMCIILGTILMIYAGWIKHNELINNKQLVEKSFDYCFKSHNDKEEIKTCLKGLTR